MKKIKIKLSKKNVEETLVLYFLFQPDLAISIIKKAFLVDFFDQYKILCDDLHSVLRGFNNDWKKATGENQQTKVRTSKTKYVNIFRNDVEQLYMKFSLEKVELRDSTAILKDYDLFYLFRSASGKRLRLIVVYGWNKIILLYGKKASGCYHEAFLYMKYTPEIHPG